jgi:16S rRNA (cytidine1402-2'-O)-methyltransferase
MPTLYLIPTPLAESDVKATTPTYIADILASLDIFIVERAKTARHHIKAMNPAVALPTLQMCELNEHDKEEAKTFFLDAIKNNKNVGLMSEAGCPGIADPGASIVALAHEKNITVMPLIGPSSILLALMASGLNGQSFTFHGYLGAKTEDLSKDLKRLEQSAVKLKQSQVFIETPYRNKNILDIALKNLNATTKLCVACDLTADTQYIKTMTIDKWKKSTLPDLHKRPTVFIIG